MSSNYTKFNAHFRKSAVAVAEELGLQFISTERQVNNGTLMFYDASTDTKYAIYETGYVRRFIRRSFYFNLNQAGFWNGYQLNPQIKTGIHITRINISNPDRLLGIMVRAVANYRKLG